MGSWNFQVFLLTLLLFVSVQALEFDEYDDDADDLSNDSDPYEYSDIAARLNCSQLMVLHKAIKAEENATGSIYNRLPSSKAYQEDHAANPENESTEKPTKTDKKIKSKRSLDGHRKLGHRHNTTPSSISTIGSTTPNSISTISTTPIVYSLETNNTNPDNSSQSVNHTVECTPVFDDDGSGYNWYQIITNNGGPPGKVNATRLTPNATKVLEPCHRPVRNTSPPLEDLLYDYELIKFEEMYRREKAFLRFAGTPSEFLDVIGQLVWSPPFSPNRYYRLTYHKDDTGFYINVRKRQKCVFVKYPLTVECNLVKNFIPCGLHFQTKVMSSGLTASLIG